MFVGVNEQEHEWGASACFFISFSDHKEDKISSITRKTKPKTL